MASLGRHTIVDASAPMSTVRGDSALVLSSFLTYPFEVDYGNPTIQCLDTEGGGCPDIFEVSQRGSGASLPSGQRMRPDPPSVLQLLPLLPMWRLRALQKPPRLKPTCSTAFGKPSTTTQ